MLPALEMAARRREGERCLRASAQCSVPVMAGENWDVRGGHCCSKVHIWSLLRRKGSLDLDLWWWYIVESKHKAALPSPCPLSSFHVP